MIASAFLADFVAVGFFFYSYSVFFIPLSEEFGTSRMGTSLGITLFGLIGALISPWIGSLLDRSSVRAVMLPGVLVSGVGFVLLSLVQDELQFYLVLALVLTTGVTAMGGITCAKLISSWYRRRLGTALGIAAVGISASGVIMPPVATWLIDSFGWRIAMTSYGGFIFFVLLPGLYFLVISHPRDIGQLTDGGPTAVPSGRAELQLQHDVPLPRQFPWSTRKLLRTRTLWLLVLCFGFMYSSVQTLFTHVVPMARDLDIDAYSASLLVSTAAFAAVCGKIGFGLFLDAFGGRNSLYSMFGLQITGLAIISLSPGFWPLLLACCIFGLGYGGGVPVQNTLTSNIFGSDSIGKSLGLTRLLSAPIMAAGAPLAGWLFDVYGSYQIAWWYHIAGLVVTLLVFMSLPSRARLMQ